MNWGTGGINHTLLLSGVKRSGISSNCQRSGHKKCKGVISLGHGIFSECRCGCHKKGEGK